ncbi:MAG TPA: ATP-binding protein [Magnetospirillaceae bacterium]|nr:ATP-binding protein [Magnetospirillaceae bacterium]
MRRFLERALTKAPRMNEDQIRRLLDILADENERVGTVLDSMLDGIVVCDPSHRPSLFNKSAERLLPLTLPDVYDRPIWENVADKEISQFLRETLVREETRMDREFALDAKGTTRLVSITVSPLVRDQRIRGTLIHLEDVTERRRKESQLRRAESLASLTTLAAGVAHEIKNPLGSLSIHVQLMRKALKSYRDGHSGAIRRYLDVMDEEIDRLNRIVVDFLFAVRPIDINLRDTDLNGLLTDLLDFLAPEIERARVHLERNLSPAIPKLRLDSRYMKQAVLNLVQNALAAMPDGGTLTLSTDRAEDGIRLSVGDTGIGIPEDNLPKIFEPYFTTKETGTGLGLTLTFKIVKEHGGDMSVRSKEGQGTLVTIVLPPPPAERRLLGHDGEPYSRLETAGYWERS